MGIGRQTPPPVNRITHRCKNITLPQTSFAGGNELEDIDLQFFLCHVNRSDNYRHADAAGRFFKISFILEKSTYNTLMII